METETPNKGETETPKAPENGTQTPAPNTGNASDSAVEQLRKEKEQAEMRANQLANQLKAKEEAEAAAKAKELEEQNQFKDLYEQEKAKREQIESEREAEERRKELKKAETGVLAEYPEEVKALVEETGMTLDSTDEEAIAAFKEKVENINKRVGATGKVGHNNPNRPNEAPVPTGDDLKLALKDPNAFAEIVSKRPGIAVMMSPKR